jgi:hypothetical protein
MHSFNGAVARNFLGRFVEFPIRPPTDGFQVGLLINRERILHEE